MTTPAAVQRLRDELMDKDRTVTKLKDQIETLERDLFNIQRDNKEMQGKTERLVIENENNQKLIKSLKESNQKLVSESQNTRGVADEESERRLKSFTFNAKLQMECFEQREGIRDEYVTGLNSLLTEKGRKEKQLFLKSAAHTIDFPFVTKCWSERDAQVQDVLFEREIEITTMLRRQADLALGHERVARIRAEQNAIEAMQAERIAREEALKEVTLLREQVALLERSKVEWLRAMPEQERTITRLTKERDHLEAQLSQYVHQSRDKHRSDEVEVGRLLERERDLKQERQKLLESIAKLEQALTQSHQEITELRSQLLTIEKDRDTVIAKAHRIKSKYQTQVDRLKGYEKDGEKAREMMETEMAELRWTRMRANEALERETLQLRAEWETHVRQLERRVNELNTALIEKDKKLTYTTMELTAYKERDKYSKGMSAPPPQSPTASHYYNPTAVTGGYAPHPTAYGAGSPAAAYGSNNVVLPQSSHSYYPQLQQQQQGGIGTGAPPGGYGGLVGPNTPNVVGMGPPSSSLPRVMSPQRQVLPSDNNVPLGAPGVVDQTSSPFLTRHASHGLPPYPAKLY
eukprot:PhF_6_TR21689/c0_g1_i1/m.30966